MMEARHAGHPWYGIGRYYTELANALGRLGVAVEPFWPGRGPEGVRGAIDHVVQYEWGLGRWGRRLQSRARVQPGTLFHFVSNSFPRGWPFKERTVITIHDLIPLEEACRSSTRQPGHGLIAPWERRSVLRALREAKWVLAVSRWTAERLAELGCRARIEVVPNGISPLFLEPATPDERKRARLRYLGEEGANALVVSAVASRSTHKNLGGLLAAVEAVARHVPAAVFLLVGLTAEEAAPLPEAQRARERLGARMRWLGRLSDGALRQLYLASDVFASSSICEGFGLPLAEAMALGVPVVAVRRSAVPEVVGDGGLLVPHGDGRSLALALERLLSDPALRRQLAATAASRARRFTWERAAALTLALYERVLSSRESRRAS